MGGWQGILALLALAWALQCVGTVVQVRRYRDAFRELSSSWNDGWMGVGKGGGAWRGAALVLLVVGPDDALRRVVAIRGRTVFSRAERLERFEGMSVETVRREAANGRKDALTVALLGALHQVDGVRRRQAERDEAEREDRDWQAAPA